MNYSRAKKEQTIFYIWLADDDLEIMDEEFLTSGCQECFEFQVGRVFHFDKWLCLFVLCLDEIFKGGHLAWQRY